jgi:N-6 DNA Methylase
MAAPSPLPGPADPPPSLARDALVAVHRIADAVAQAWHTAYASDRPDIPLSVVAALTLRTPGDRADQVRVASLLTDADDGGLLGFLRATWQLYAHHRPDLIRRVMPLAEPWFTDPRPGGDLLRAVRRIVRAALGAGLFELLTVARHDVDVFGPLLAVLRTRTARAAAGQFYTPPDVGALLAQLNGVPTEPGEMVYEPAVGTGGLFLSAAHAVRERGGDPATVCWIGEDSDELALAACAVNVIVWQLGPRVLLAHGDVLAAADGPDRAVRERGATLTLTRMIAAAQSALDLLQPPRDPEPIT